MLFYAAPPENVQHIYFMEIKTKIIVIAIQPSDFYHFVEIDGSIKFFILLLH